MKTQSDNTLNVYQQQMATTQEVCHVLADGVGRMENIWLKQTSRAIEEQIKLFHAVTATQDPQELTTLPFTFFSHTPEDLMNTQREILDVVTETQTKISDSLNKHAAVLKTKEKPFLASNITNNAIGLTGVCYSAWQKAIQDAIGLANLGFKSLPAMPLRSSATPPKEEGPATKR